MACDDGQNQVNRYDSEGLRYEMKENEKLFRFIYHRGELLYKEEKDEATSYPTGVWNSLIKYEYYLYLSGTYGIKKERAFWIKTGFFIAVGRVCDRDWQRLAFPIYRRTKWHLHGYVALIGNYCLMMFYTVVSGWMIYYFYSFITSKFEGMSSELVGDVFGQMLANPGLNLFWMCVVVVLGILVCSIGLQKGVEKITTKVMIALLAFRGLTLEGGLGGLKFYLYPDFGKMREVGFGKVVTAAMNQSFFTLSLGIGAMAIFGSYIGNERSLVGEAVPV